MRISSAWLALVLIGCGTDPVDPDASIATRDANTIDCALDGAREFSSACRIERSDRNAVILRHRSGGFRKIILEGDEVIDTADGAETVRVRMLEDGRAEVSIGEDRYRLPTNL